MFNTVGMVCTKASVAVRVAVAFAVTVSDRVVNVSVVTSTSVPAIASGHVHSNSAGSSGYSCDSDGPRGSTGSFGSTGVVGVGIVGVGGVSPFTPHPNPPPPHHPDPHSEISPKLFDNDVTPQVSIIVDNLSTLVLTPHLSPTLDTIAIYAPDGTTYHTSYVPSGKALKAYSPHATVCVVAINDPLLYRLTVTAVNVPSVPALYTLFLNVS